ncbi:MAG: rhomboid family intramembrane serine protease [Gammaproteobacteria bacterium]|nr:rhomboid family intramembrane serine protease [Gammaproteobacteria bacterium]
MHSKSLPSEQVRKVRLYWHLTYFIVFLWVIKAAEELFHFSLHSLGVYPGKLEGLIGVLTAPLIHGDWEHLANNSFSMILLGALTIYGYVNSTYRAIGVIWIVSGVGVWLLGRESYHFGASGLTHGLFYFLFIAAILRRDKRSIALMLVAVFMYGSMVLGVLPWDPKISFEAHLFGAIGGGLGAFWFARHEPKPLEKRYHWEMEDDLDDEDPYWLPEHQQQSYQHDIDEQTNRRDKIITEIFNTDERR